MWTQTKFSILIKQSHANISIIKMSNAKWQHEVVGMKHDGVYGKACASKTDLYHKSAGYSVLNRSQSNICE